MRFLDRLAGYNAEVICSNCNHHSIIRAKRGMTIEEFLKTADAKCRNCGCKVVRRLKR